ncbi:MAG: carboxypeptidase-like regulatory domain-containing protein [Segetibacter sp.]
MPALSVFLLLFSSSIYAQQKVITGRVTDENAQPLAGVSVRIKGTTTGGSTGANGSYSVSANQGQVLEFTYVGKASMERTVGAENVINVSLTEGDASNLNEVVVTGYITQRKG